METNKIKEAFETPEAEVILFGCEDVILTSGEENEMPFVPADM